MCLNMQKGVKQKQQATFMLKLRFEWKKNQKTWNSF